LIFQNRNLFTERLFSNEELLLAALFVAYFLYSVIIVIPSGTFYVDEGWAADIGNSLVGGKLLYRDLSVPYGPVIFNLYAALIENFGKELIVFRIAGMFVLMAAGYFAYLNSKILCNCRRIALLSPILLLVVLGTYQGCRLSASTVAGLCSLIILYSHLQYRESTKLRYLVIGAVFLSISLFTKHNIFIFDMLAHSIFAILTTLRKYKLNRRINLLDIQYLLVTPLIVGLVVVIYFLTIIDYLDLFVESIFGQIGDYSVSISISFPSPIDLAHMTGVEIRNSIFLYAPIFFMILVGSVLFKLGNTKLAGHILLVLLVGFFQYSQIFPISDFSHYARATIVLSVLVPAIILLLYDHNQQHWGLTPLLGILIILHIYYPIYYQAAMIKKIITSPESRLPYNSYIKENPNEKTLLRLLRSMKNNDDLLILGHANELYYFADLVNPTRWSAITSHYIHGSDQQEIILAYLQARNFSLIVEAPPIRTERELVVMAILGRYIREHYFVDEEIGEFKMWRRNYPDIG